MIYTDINGITPKRFKAKTRLTQNLRYEPANSKVKYYANGTAIDGTSQSVIFAASKTFTSTQQAKLRVGRLTGIAYNGYNGTQKVGYINAKYSGALLLHKDGSTQYYLNSNYLDNWVYNGKTYGTVNWPIEKCYLTPSSGLIDTQRHVVDAD
ncbi:MAG: hypothetical protein QHH15_06475 [Candidatus Thermoplasmatota archaeon]|nr:hypothetical protein [Candidatus Thermoplasmatota archaeon]